MGDVVGELEPGFGQAARGELVREPALGGARLDFIDDQPREPFEMDRVGLRDVGARYAVDHRERAEALAAAGDQRRNSAEAQPAGLHRGDGGQPRIGGGVGDQHHAIGAQRALAQSELRAIGLPRPPAGGKKPDPGGRHGKEASCDRRDMLEASLGVGLDPGRWLAAIISGRWRHCSTLVRAARPHRGDINGLA